MKKLFLTTALMAGMALAQTATTTTTPSTTTPAAPASSTPAAAPATTPTSTTSAATTPAAATPATTTPATTTLATPAPAATPAAPAPVVTPATPAPDTVVAKIGSEVVTYAQFDLAFRQAVARLLNQQGVPFSEDIYKQFAGARAEYLKQFVRERELAQLARTAGKPDAAAIDAKFKSIRDRFKTDDEFKQALAQTGYADEAALRASLEESSLTSAYLTGLQKKFTFGDSVVSGYYTLHKAAFNRPAQACAKHILVATEAEAKDIAKLLQTGGAANSFDKLAQQKSKDPGSAAQGGDLGCFGPGQMVPSFDKASFNGPLNTVQTVQSQFGWHLLVVTKRTPAGLMPLTEAAPLIRQQLTQDAAQKYLDSQLARIKVETHPEVFPAPAPAAAPAAAPVPAPANK